MDSLSERTIKWMFDDGPMAGVTFDHEFAGDGSVTWRIVDGPMKGASKREKSYAAVRVNTTTWAVSYLAASGHTLTVVLSLDDGRAVGFASDNSSWVPMHGRFEFVD